jgi:hypothetical protein
VDLRVAGGASLIISDTPPVATSPGLMWFDSVGAQCYMWYSDANSSQWVPLNAPPALAASVAYLPLAGGTMTGPLIQAADPVAALGTATKQYVDAGTVAAEHNVGRNLLHNSLFNIAQRGAGPWTANGAYTADRWQMNANLDTFSVGTFAFNDASRTQIGDEAATRGLNVSFTGNSGAAAFSSLGQKIEGVRRLASKTVTLSFFAGAGAAGLRLGANLYQSFGTGGSPSPGVQGNGQSVAITTAYARYSLTFTVPSAAGMTLGTNGDDLTAVNFYFSCGTTNAALAGNIGVQSGSVSLWGVQLEIGATATPLEKPDPQQDLAKCQRFFQNGNAYLNCSQTAGQAFGYLMPFSVAFRAIPTVTPNSTGYTNASGLVAAQITPANMLIYAVAGATGSCNFNTGFTASADL